jgi:hypothetical protein
MSWKGSLDQIRLRIAFRSPTMATRIHISTRWTTFSPLTERHTTDTRSIQNIATSKTGHVRNNIVNFKKGIVTRGVLIDIPCLKGAPYLEAGTPIYTQDIEACEKVAGVRVSKGDALFVRTGRWARRAAVGPWDVHNLRAGLDISVVPWLRQRDIATLGSDVAQSIRPKLPNLGPLGDLHDFTLSVLGSSVLIIQVRT